MPHFTNLLRDEISRIPAFFSTDVDTRFEISIQFSLLPSVFCKTDSTVDEIHKHVPSVSIERLVKIIHTVSQQRKSMLLEQGSVLWTRKLGAGR